MGVRTGPRLVITPAAGEAYIIITISPGAEHLIEVEFD
jgi:hypothetical protein